MQRVASNSNLSIQDKPPSLQNICLGRFSSSGPLSANGNSGTGPGDGSSRDVYNQLSGSPERHCYRLKCRSGARLNGIAVSSWTHISPRSASFSVGSAIVKIPSPKSCPPVPRNGSSHSRLVHRSMQDITILRALASPRGASSPLPSPEASPLGHCESFVLLGHTRSNMFTEAGSQTSQLANHDSQTSIKSSINSSPIHSLPMQPDTHTSVLNSSPLGSLAGRAAPAPTTSTGVKCSAGSNEEQENTDPWGVSVLAAGAQAVVLGLQLASSAVEVANTSLAPAVEAIVEVTSAPSMWQQHAGTMSHTKASSFTLNKLQLLEAPSMNDSTGNSGGKLDMMSPRMGGGTVSPTAHQLMQTQPSGGGAMNVLPARAQTCLETMAQAMTQSIDDKDECASPCGQHEQKRGAASYRSMRPPPLLSPRGSVKSLSASPTGSSEDSSRGSLERLPSKRHSGLKQMARKWSSLLVLWRRKIRAKGKERSISSGPA